MQNGARKTERVCVQARHRQGDEDEESGSCPLGPPTNQLDQPTNRPTDNCLQLSTKLLDSSKWKDSLKLTYDFMNRNGEGLEGVEGLEGSYKDRG